MLYGSLCVGGESMTMHIRTRTYVAAFTMLQVVVVVLLFISSKGKEVVSEVALVWFTR